MQGQSTIIKIWEPIKNSQIYKILRLACAHGHTLEKSLKQNAIEITHLGGGGE